MKKAEIERITKTRINMNLNADGTEKGNMESGIGFFGIKARIRGDLKAVLMISLRVLQKV